MSFLIREMTEEVHYITETIDESTSKKNLFIEGVFMQSDVKNRNGRVYPAGILDREVSRYNENFIARNRAFGELDHPQGPSINLDRVSHMITSLKREGTNFVGKAKILEDLPMGKIAKGLIDSGATLAVSSRGMGSMKRNSHGIMEVQEDFYLATAADIVADPSCTSAYVDGIMEGYAWVFEVADGQLKDAGNIETHKLIETQVKEIKESRAREIDLGKAVAMFESFIKSIR